MSDIQNILAALIAAIKEKRITVDVAEAAVKMLDGVPEYCHMDAVKALLRTPSSDEEQPEDCIPVELPVNVKLFVSVEESNPEEQPENYVAVKTFTSSEFHIGDEVVVCNDRKGVYIATDTIIGSCLLMDSGELACYFDKDAWTRTGRNFPAIPAILEELKRLDK